ncbi:hypothetical protein DSO57_1016471 [Entomophthora muscae]|uniref:Uncharacterized protein n=1 Tax=Entomophthora muscae TaxID=34485 RepID=A0ACC2STV5_9FUNG|nr:hypothetical protein DSO57_1016471 [Entomophthora muscae]
MVAFLHWERIPTLQFHKPEVMWSTLMLALENPYVISTKRLKVGNNIDWKISRMKLLSQAGSQKSMILVGNLVLSGSKTVYHQRLHHIPKYIEWLLGVMYLVGGKAPKEYAQQESLLLECVFLGLVFPYSIGVTLVNFLPIDDSPFLPFAFCWLPNVWIIFAAVAKVLIQLCLGLEAIVS